MAYEFLEHTADIKFRATGATLDEALAESARALTEAIVGKAKIEPKQVREFSVTIHKPQILVHDFLQELVYLFSAEHLVFSGFELELRESMGYRLKAKVAGEPYDEKRHGPATEVKAVTYHDMVVEETGKGWVIEVVCDT